MRCEIIVEIKKLVNIEIKKIEKSTIILTDEIWCTRAYPNHPKGCPNYGKNPLCPPNSVDFASIVDNYNHFYLLYLEFDFFKYWLLRLLEAIKTHTLDYWTSERLECLLYWQNSVKKFLRDKSIPIFKLNLGKKIFLLGCGSGFNTKNLSKYQEKIFSMESTKINALSTMRLNKIPAKTYPIDLMHFCCLFASEEELILPDSKPKPDLNKKIRSTPKETITLDRFIKGVP